MSISTSDIAEVCARHPWKTLAFWLVLIAVGVFLASGLDSVLNGDDDFTNNPDSKHANTLIDQRFGMEPPTETIVLTSSTLTVDDPLFRQTVEQTTTDLLALDAVVSSATNYYQATASGDPNADHMVSANRHSAVIPVILKNADEDLYGATFVSTAQGQANSDVSVYAVGDLSGDQAYEKIADDDLAAAEQVGLPVALVVLVVVFGALIAAGLPIILGVATIVLATGLTAFVGNWITLTDEVTVMISMIGLAVGIDYALFVIERYREERRHGRPRYEAINLAGGTAGKAVLFSGATVVLALTGMFFIPVTVFHSLATGAILAVVVAVLATQTLLPAMLGLLGDRVNWPRRGGWRKEGVQARRREGAEFTSSRLHASNGAPPSRLGFWGRITRLVMNRPVGSIVIASVILVGLALPVLDLRTGQTGLETLPASDVKTGYQILERDFYAGVVAPVEIVVDGRTDDQTLNDGIQHLVASLQQQPLYGPAEIETAPGGDLTVISVPMSVDPDSPAAYDAIDALRDETIPAAFGSQSDKVLVTGSSAEQADFNHVLRDSSPKVFGFVLGLSFLLLLLAFRSVVVPAKAIVMNLLSVGAAYGVLVLVFQHGIGADLLGFQQTETIVAWLPVFLFCVLFGLSMDYHVFLLSRIREHFDLTGRNEEAVAVGLQATGKIISGAALIMVAVFGAFASGRMVDIQQMGFGLAVAIFLDATVVRCLLVPAAMRLLDNRNWYLPRWLHWLPDLRIEGATHPATPELAPSAHAPHSLTVSPFSHPSSRRPSNGD